MKKASWIAWLLIVLLLISAVPALADAPQVVSRSDRYDLSNFGYRTVKIDGPGTLVFQKAPRGSFMSAYQYEDGDRIYVNLTYREKGYALAYKDGVYGYVDAKYINWGSSGGKSGGGSSSADRDLSNFVYRRVRISGSGTLVFQEAPAGPFMSRFQYYDGDWIYVNPNWRKDGYTLAYSDGVYGYVDERYIDWNSRRSSSSGGKSGGGSGDAKDLSNYAYRRVKIKGSGALVFQKKPAGEFMSRFKYYDGDQIYVNIHWRKDGYAMAYADGVYGYVDARYIAW